MPNWQIVEECGDRGEEEHRLLVIEIMLEVLGIPQLKTIADRNM